MGWEEIGWMDASCPCGRGVVMTVREMDESNRIRKRSYMFCDACDELAREKWDDDRKRSENEKKKVLDLRERILSHFDLRYLRDWQAHFALSPSKKAVWEILHQNGVFSRGLTTFYGDLREEPLPCFLRNIATVSNIGKILCLLEIQDEELEQLLHEIHILVGNDYIYLLWNR